MERIRIGGRARSPQLAELVRLQDEWASARRGRVAAFTTTALFSLSWLARAHPAAWLPAHAVDLGVALWATVLVVAFACRVHEWRLARRLARLIASARLDQERVP